ncbi:MAG: CoA transferase [Chloroflexota bacterium]
MGFPGALDDLKVIDFGTLFSGPYCARLLGDLGAEVIKIEEPLTGDPARRMEPFPHDSPGAERSGFFLYSNFNKLGVTLNPRTATGRDIFIELIKQADILVTNRPPAEMEALGLDYPHLQQANSRLIVTSVTPFGSYGPRRDWRGDDLVSFSAGGLTYLTPYSAEDPEKDRPLRAAGRQAHFLAGSMAAAATMSAVLMRWTTGKGQLVDVSQQEVVLSMRSPAVTTFDPGKPTARIGLPSGGAVGLVRCADGYVCFVTMQESEWQGLVELMGNPEWLSSPLFKARAERAKHWDACLRLVEEWTTRRTKEQVRALCQSKRVPCEQVNSPEDIVNYKHLWARGFFQEWEQPAVGKVTTPGRPFVMSGTPWRFQRPAPLLGQHNEEVFCKRLGYSRTELVKLTEARII